MKTHTIKTPTAELLLVELPENIERDYSLIYGTNPEETYLSFRKNAEFKPPQKSEKLENGIWKLLGKPDEIREEDAKQLVQAINVGTSTRYVPSVKFYNSVRRAYFETAKESLLSFLGSEITEQFDKTRTLVFVKKIDRWKQSKF